MFIIDSTSNLLASIGANINNYYLIKFALWLDNSYTEHKNFLFQNALKAKKLNVISAFVEKEEYSLQDTSNHIKGELLIKASQVNNKELFSLIFEEERNNIRDSHKEEAFREAALSGHKEIVLMMLGTEFPKSGNILKGEVLKYAVIFKWIDVLSLVIEKETNNIYDHHKAEALIFAALNGYTDIVSFILSKERHNISNEDKINALFKAAKNGHKDTATYLFEEEINNFSTLDKILATIYAKQEGYTEVILPYLNVKHILNDIDGDTARKIIPEAIRGECDYIIEFFINKYGIKILTEQVNHEGAKQNLIFIQGPDPTHAISELADNVSRISANKEVNTLIIKANNKYIGLNEIENLIREFSKNNDKVTVIVAMHGNPGNSTEKHTVHFHPEGGSGKLWIETGILFKTLTKALNNQPFDLLLQSCFGAISSNDALAILPLGSNFLAQGETEIFNIETIVSKSIKFVSNNINNINLSLDHLFKLTICYQSSYYQYPTTLITDYGKELKLRKEAENLMKSGFKFTTELREIIHNRLNDISTLCDSTNELEITMDQMETGSVTYFHDNTMLVLTKEIFDIHNDPNIYTVS
jgi:hypothetical protein